MSAPTISCGGGGAGGGLAQGAGDTIADEELVRGDTPTGLQGASVKLSDTTGVFTNTTVNGGFEFVPNGTGKHWIGAGQQFGLWFTDNRGYILENGVPVVEFNGTVVKIRGVDGVYQFADGADATATGVADAGMSRAGPADIAFGNGAANNASAFLRFGGARCKGFTSSAGAASTTELPTDKDWSLHKNTGSGVVSLAFNDGGVIKSVALA